MGAEAMATLTELVDRRDEIRTRLEAARANLERELARLSRVLDECRTTKAARAESGGWTPPTMTRLFATDRVRLGDVEVVVARQAVRDARGTRRLTPTEWQLLVFLLTYPDMVHTRSQLAAGAWGGGFDGRDTEVEVYISRLRRKLGRAASLLETVRGQGYRLVFFGDSDADEGLAGSASA